MQFIDDVSAVPLAPLKATGLQNNYRVIAFLRIMPCINISFLFVNVFKLHQEIHLVRISF